MITGNTLLRCTQSVPIPPGPSCPNAQAGTESAGNNDFEMVAQDSDADASTATSSSANLALPSGARVLFAGLFWGAGGSSVPAGEPSSVPGSRGDVSDCHGKHADVQGSPVRDYSSYVDVTALVQAAGNGTYWGAGIATPTGVNRYAGGAWWWRTRTPPRRCAT